VVRRPTRVPEVIAPDRVVVAGAGVADALPARGMAPAQMRGCASARTGAHPELTGARPVEATEL
jgi:hypothetical protein